MDNLSDYNKKAHEKYMELQLQRQQRKMAGVLCDKCNAEMYYPEPNTVLASNPPQMAVKCPNPECNNYGYKVK